MSYLPLARKYRPMNFSDLVGQESVTKAISNAISLGREPHAVIFSGVRGIGKTTTARLYAKALNCEDTSTPEPCNKCNSCLSITKGIHEDVIEIDGASNNGVDEIRSIKESVSYIPQRSKYKVYIIDEVHMLSTSAFNALLKTLEEPPSHVVFVFATTELHKVPQTVVGRCQTFYLQKIRLSTMIDRVSEILKMEDISFEEKAISLVAREGHGSMRDALSFLDQAIALGGGEVTLEGVSQLTSNLSAAPYIDLLDSIIRKDASKLIELVEKLDEEGQVFREVCEETAKVARHAFVIKELGKDHLDVAILGLDDQDVTNISDICNVAGLMDLNRVFRTLVKCVSDMGGSSLDRFIFENYLLEWCVDPGLPSVDQLLAGKSIPVTPQQVQTSHTPMQSSHESPSKPRRSLMASFAEATASDQKKNLASNLGEKVTPTSTNVEKDVSVSETSQNEKNSSNEPEAQLTSADDRATPNNSTAIPTTISAKVEEVESESTVSGQNSGFPNTWRDLVDAWKKHKPLQARKLEEVHPIEYSAAKIVVAVDPQGIVGPALLKSDTQVKIAKAFGELFGFTGTFSAVPRSGATKDAAVLENLEETSSESTIEPVEEATVQTEGLDESQLPDSILQEKTKEVEQRRIEVTAAAENSSVVHHLKAGLGVDLKKVEITNPALL